MRVVVTGDAGLIGANLCRRLAETQGIESVVAYDDLSTEVKETLVGTDAYVGSVVSVLTDALARRVTAVEPVNLAFGSRTSLLGLIAVLEEVLGQPLEGQHGDPRAGDVRDSQADSARLRSLFADVERVPLLEGIRATVGLARQPNLGRSVSSTLQPTTTA